MHLKLPILLAIFFSFASTEPIIIKSGLTRDHSQGQANDAKVFDSHLSKEDHDYANQQGYNDGSEIKFVNAQDAGNYNHEKEDKKLREEEGDYNDEKFRQQQGNNESKFGKKLGHKKGHHKSGFHNTYHKDESGSNSSYYDDNNDEADEYVHNSNRGAFGDHKSGHNRGVYEDLNGHRNHNSKHGGFNNGGSFNKEAGGRDHYNRGKQHDDRLHEGQSSAGNQYGEHGQHFEEKHYTKPHHPIYQTNYNAGNGGFSGGGANNGYQSVGNGYQSGGSGYQSGGSQSGGSSYQSGGSGYQNGGNGFQTGGGGYQNGGNGYQSGGGGGSSYQNGVGGYQNGGSGFQKGGGNYQTGGGSYQSGGSSYSGGSSTYYPRDQFRSRLDYERPSKQVITVYEDPRYYEQRYDSFAPNYDSERVHLDVKKPNPYRRTSYYAEKPYYDEYYY